MIKITPVGRTIRRLNSFRRHRTAIRRGITSALFDIGKIAALHIITLIRTGSRTGRFYRRPWGLHQASRKGEPPKEDFSALHRGVDYKVRGSQLEVGESEPYGPTLEFGQGRLKGAPRPHISATEVAIRAEAIEFLERRVSEEVRSLL